ncbi:transposase [Endozoicomonas sp. ISHI1]|uniref:transposase n=1 Tax=Endozoicomonas sp. ISHI1 TaxID=2825882 RepID=UPI0035A0926B
MESQVIDVCLSQAKEGKALYTFGHELKCHVHVHRSLTCGGLTDDKTLIPSSILTALVHRKQRIESLKVYSCTYWSVCLSPARLSRRLTVLSLRLTRLGLRPARFFL